MRKPGSDGHALLNKVGVFAESEVGDGSEQRRQETQKRYP